MKILLKGLFKTTGTARSYFFTQLQFIYVFISDKIILLLRVIRSVYCSRFSFCQDLQVETSARSTAHHNFGTSQ